MLNPTRLEKLESSSSDGEKKKKKENQTKEAHKPCYGIRCLEVLEIESFLFVNLAIEHLDLFVFEPRKYIAFMWWKVKQETQEAFGLQHVL